MRVFVTGNRGYIGSALVESLKNITFIKDIVGYDLVEGDDICDLENLENKMMDANPDVVIHLAAASSVSECNENPKKAFKVNALGTRNVLNAMNKCGCQNIIYASTSSVYNYKNELPLKEDGNLSPSSVYGITKLMGEQMIYENYEIKGRPGNYIIFRMFNVVGKTGFEKLDKDLNLGYDRIFSALESGKFTIYGKDYPTRDGTCERDYVSVRDICVAYVRGIIYVMEGEGRRQILNLSTGVGISVLELIKKWEKYNCGVKYGYGERREGDPPRIYGSTKLAHKILYWEAINDIDKIIAEFGLFEKVAIIG